MTLPDTVAVVTGASEGIGRAIAAALIEAGAVVHGLARSKDRLAAVAADLGDRFVSVVCDVTDAAAVRAAIDAVAERHGRLDVLVSNAGVGRFGPVDALSDEDWTAQVDTNLSGVFYGTRAAVPHMKRAGRGHIVNVASVAGLVGNPDLSAYNATKYGVRGFSDATMKELRPHGIKVTCLYPGSVATGFGDSDPSPTAIPPQAVAATVRHVLEAPDSTLISEVVMRPMAVKK
ncbi:MAG TPA: SDR family NAD(P)-dependent oxidoreductase [Rubricoccaceae bacterium]|jgi:NAD(P)-dependent dehydrogenase (short-subunit alcohol dehydrogenase family)